MNSRTPSLLFSLLPKLYLPLLAALCFIFAWQPLRGIDDFWAHAAIGRWIAQNGRVPDETLFLWGPGTPIPWVYHSWLSQFVFFKLLDWGGLEGGASAALLLTYFVALASLLWLWITWARRSPITALTPFLFAIALWCSSARFHPRPELFSGFFLVVLLTFLLVWTERRTLDTLPNRLPLRLAGLFALFVLWTNLHGGVATGLVFIGLTIVGEAVQDYVDKRSFKPTLILCGVLLLCALAINVNPYGVHYWSALKPVGGVMFSLINEWKPIFKEPVMSPESMVITGLLAYLSLISWLQNPSRRYAHLLWLLFAVFSYVMARRQILQMAEVCLLVMAANAVSLDTKRLWNLLLPRKKPIKDEAGEEAPTAVPHLTSTEPPPVLRLAGRISVIIVLVMMIPSAMNDESWPFRSLSSQLPVRAAEFVKQKCTQARLFSDYSTSSYLDWHLAGQPPLYIDLLNAYPDQLFVDYFAITYKEPRGLKLLYDLNVTHVLIKRLNPNNQKDKIAAFADYMNGNPRWKLIYDGPDARVWVRRDLENRDFSKKNP